MTTTFRAMDFEKGDWDYVKGALPGAVFVEDMRGVVAIRNGKVGGILFFDAWTYTCCNAHQVITDPMILIEGFMEEVWGWIFSPTGGKRTKVTGIYPDDRIKARLLAERLGFVEIARVKDGFQLGVDQVVVEMTKEQCRYLP